jgi:hypothetical protein
VSRNGTAQLEAVTQPQIPCTIKVDDGSNTVPAGLGPKTSNASGYVTWTWTVVSRRGTWPVTVTCTRGSERASATEDLVVV